jgi:glutamyl-tRNA reductase
MIVWVCGINYKTASLPEREKLAMAWQNQAEFLASAKTHVNLDSITVVITCNRIECYIIAEDLDSWFLWLTKTYHINSAWFLQNGYVLQGNSALEHILNVASGIDSMVVGENQILGQLKKSYQLAMELGTISGMGNNLFAWVFRQAKQIRTNSGLGEHHVSVASVAVQWLKNKLHKLHQAKIMLIGSGDTAHLVAKYLKDYGCEKFYLATRTLEHATALAHNINAELINVLEISKYLADVDVVITATNCPVPFIDRATLDNVTIINKLYLLDLAMPRNINPDVQNNNNIELINLDELACIVTQGQALRVKAAAIAQNMISDAVSEYCYLNYARISEYRAKATRYLQQELTQGLQKLQDNSDPKEVLTTVCNRLANKLMHMPTMWLKTAEQNIKEALEE